MNIIKCVEANILTYWQIFNVLNRSTSFYPLYLFFFYLSLQPVIIFYYENYAAASRISAFTFTERACGWLADSKPKKHATAFQGHVSGSPE